MKQKIFLTSCIAMGFVAPAFAEPSNTGTFPADGYMEEDYTYTNAATADNMDSVYEGNVNAIAEYTEIPYSAEEGFYLTGVDNNNEAITAECTSGNFCPGVASTTYENNAFVDTGLQSCSTATSGAYTLSDAGASSSGQCYRTCDGHVSILHATGVTGNDYSDGTNTCAPTGCENGWHVKDATPNLTNIIGVSEGGTDYGYISNNGIKKYHESTYGITQNGEFVIDYGNRGKIHGYARCSARGVENPWLDNNRTFESDHFVETLPDSTGQNCYCGMDGYTANGSNITIALSGPWVFLKESDTSCERYCAYECADALAYPGDSFDGFLGAFLAAYPANPAMCEANVININWYNADANDISANNAGTATYGSDVRTPVKAQTIKGKTFKGWRFSKPQQTNLP